MEDCVLSVLCVCIMSMESGSFQAKCEYKALSTEIFYFSTSSVDYCKITMGTLISGVDEHG